MFLVHLVTFNGWNLDNVSAVKRGNSLTLSLVLKSAFGLRILCTAMQVYAFHNKKKYNFEKVHTTVCSTIAITVTSDYLLSFLLCSYPTTEASLSHAAHVSNEAFLGKIQSSVLQLKDNYTHMIKTELRDQKALLLFNIIICLKGEAIGGRHFFVRQTQYI